MLLSGFIGRLFGDTSVQVQLQGFSLLHLKQSNLTSQMGACAYSLLLPSREGSARVCSHDPPKHQT